MSAIDELLRSMYSNYARSVGLDPDANYVFGAPLRPVVPLDHGTGSVFFLGAYPSARFAVCGGISDVPFGDNSGPFENERWFDGSRVRSQPSARELQDHFIGPLGLDRGKCWITDLVKVFLFKEGHANKYLQLGVSPPSGYERERFHELGKKSLFWIARELSIAHPRLLITLGAEVAGVLQHVPSGPEQAKLLDPCVKEDFDVAGIKVATIHCAHPGILMRQSEKNAWPDRHSKEFIPAIQEYLSRVTR